MGVGGYFGFKALNGFRRRGRTRSRPNWYPVTRGNLVSDVSVTGTLTYAAREAVSFGQQGVVSEISVSEGDEVSEGESAGQAGRGDHQRTWRRQSHRLGSTCATPRRRWKRPGIPIPRRKSPGLKPMWQMRDCTSQDAEEDLNELGVVSPDLLVQARIDILNATADLESANESKVTLETPTTPGHGQGPVGPDRRPPRPAGRGG